MNELFEPLILNLIAVVIVIIGVVFLCRELVCWYFKTSENIRLLKEIKELLKNINDKLSDKEKGS